MLQYLHVACGFYECIRAAYARPNMPQTDYMRFFIAPKLADNTSVMRMDPCSPITVSDYTINYFGFLLPKRGFARAGSGESHFQGFADTKLADTYHITLGSIEDLYTAKSSGKELPRFYDAYNCTIYTLPRLFMNEVRLRRPRALAILAHLVCLDKGIKEYWWLPNHAVVQVECLAAMAPQKWKWAFEWPMAVAQGLVDLTLPLEGLKGHAKVVEYGERLQFANPLLLIPPRLYFWWATH